MRRQIALVFTALLVLSSVAVSPVAAESQVYGQPELSLSVADDIFQASESATLSITATNTGRLDQAGAAQYESRVQTAQSVRMDVIENQIDAPIDVKTGTLTRGSIPDTSTARFNFDVEFGHIEPGTYEIPVEMTYRYVRMVTYGGASQPEYVWSTRTERTSVTIEIEERPQFAVVGEGPNSVIAGDTGRLSFSLENTGSREATAASVQLTAQSPTVFFGRLQSDQRSTNLYVPSLAPGETTNLSVHVGATSETQPGQYPIEVGVQYKNQNGITEHSDTLTTGVSVAPEHTFAIRDLQTTNFRVDESEATISGRIVNTGSESVGNAAVRLGSMAVVTPTNGESAVGDLAAGESKPISFTLSIPASAEPGTNTFPFTVEYENADGDVRASTPIRTSLAIGAERSPFTITNVSTDVSPGGSDSLTVNIRYNGDQPVSATNAKVFVSDPLSTSDDGAYLGTMRPGETETATFTVSAGSDALSKEYAASIEVRYDDADGDTKYTNGLPIGISVSPASGGLPVPLPVIVVVLVVAGGAYVIYLRR